ncbi:MAG: HAMP domain-containing histidine kinase [Oscillospiraceae bacterium]|nr:HAMP domain-containing histidine kinase [Oscillospiraceae bacterium]
MKKISLSLKWSFLLYLPLCFLISVAGSFGIGVATNYLQDWYRSKYPNSKLTDSVYYEMHINEDGNAYVVYTDSRGNPIQTYDQEHQNIYWIISNAQLVLVPIWVIICIVLTGAVFYNRELKNPIKLLMDASKKISENQLDFKIEYKKQNEIGALCTAFDEMRSALYESNREMWRSLEERKRLNSAFSHDLRTPLTVLKGYSDYLEKYVPEGKVNEEKLMSVISMMNGQISRLEHYTQKMNAVQKLEDIVPQAEEISAEKLFESLSGTGKLLCGEKNFSSEFSSDSEDIYIDSEIVMQVYENLVSNAVRYAEKSVNAVCEISEGKLKVSVLDDGAGFTDEALKNAVQPFFRDEKEPDKIHFGLGLYICKILCEKCGGGLTVSNHENGGRVTAEFFCTM